MSRLLKLSRYFLTFVLDFVHGGLLMAGVMVIALASYQVARHGMQGLNPRIAFGGSSSTLDGRATAQDIVPILHAQSEHNGLAAGMSRISVAIAKRHHVSPLVAEVLVKTAQEEGQASGVDPLLILAVITVESGFNPFFESPLGAQGLMQIIPRFNADKMSGASSQGSLFDPKENIRVGSLMLKSFLTKAGSTEAALQLYGGASGNVDMAYASHVLQELERLQQIAGTPANRGTVAGGQSGKSAGAS